MKKAKQLVKEDTLAEDLQVLLHRHGADKFIRALIHACFMAGSDTEDFENKSISQKYIYYGNALDEMEYFCPNFLGDEENE